MERLTKEKPESNVDALFNFAFADDGEVKLAYAGDEEHISLVKYIRQLAKEKGCECSEEDIMNGDSCGCCDECDCPVAVLNIVAIQAAELRARLKAIEDILGDEYDLERLKQLLAGDNFTQEDMSAAYTSGYEIGRKQGPEGDTGAQGPRGVPERCDTCPAIFAVKAVAASDLQPVVRCKDCDVPHNKWTGCPNLNGMIPPADFYCARGERRRTDD